MNHGIREFLIDQCVKGQPIYYEDIGQILNLNLGLDSDRHILSKTLGEISVFEFENERPLISAIAIYKQKNDHGYGFYNLCEELKIGKAKQLHEMLFGFTQIEECKRFWKKPENYNAYYSIGKEKIIHSLEFFTPQEIEFLSQWGGKEYDKNNNEHISSKNYIMNSVGNKVRYWSNHIANNIPNMDTFNWRMWSQKGWKDTPNGKVQIARFKKYSWARVFRKGDNNKDIFFTVEATGESKELVFKLDYYFESNSNLNAEQKEIVKKNIPKELRWRSIPVGELINHNWDSLLELSMSFVSEHLHIYDKLIKLAWGDSIPQEVFSNFLRPQTVPQNGVTVLPNLNPSFQGIEKDFIQESIDKKEIGDAGEELVKQYEINRLKNIGYDDLSVSVKIVKDGMGYDILSFDENRKPKYIEVKTTSGKSLTPFYYSINEKLFAEQNKEQYFIYRLYNYDEESNTADFYIIKNVNENLLMQPIEFKVYLKKQN
nr:DUF3883 domain-containing protein [uncultured Flavobacterium sp.]